MYFTCFSKRKNKATLATGHGDLQDCERSRLPLFLDNPAHRRVHMQTCLKFGQLRNN